MESRLAILDIVRRSATDGNAVCYSTNNIAEVEELDGSVAILDRGRVLARGTVREVIAAHATGIAELTFEGEAPTLEDAARVEPSTLRIRHRDPGAAVARALRRLDSDASRVRSVEITRPSLETAFLALTGRRYREDERDDDAG